MKAVYIYPEDIGTTQFSEEWLNFIRKFGFEDVGSCSCLLLTSIETNQ